ncbi:MAG TPA: hypothetical protein VJG83_05735 [archaeon]|nr:hypothetical protein [archaeon]
MISKTTLALLLIAAVAISGCSGPSYEAPAQEDSAEQTSTQLAASDSELNDMDNELAQMDQDLRTSEVEEDEVIEVNEDTFS